MTSSVAEALEGDVITLKARVARARQAKRAVLERLDLPDFEGIGDSQWVAVKATKVHGRTRLSFKALVTEANAEKFRIRVAYAGIRRPSVSKPVSVRMWRWIPLREFTPYYDTVASGFYEGSIAGRSYPAWGAQYWSQSGAEEARFTPGRNCRAFKGVAGLTDISADGSSGRITMTADDQPVWQSPELTPGAAVPFQVSIALPYRVALATTSSTARGVKAYPAIGDPALLCSGI